MSAHSWEVVEVPLDNGNFMDGVQKKLHNIEFTNDVGTSIYPVETERFDIDELLVVMSDGTEFILSCKKEGE